MSVIVKQGKIIKCYECNKDLFETSRDLLNCEQINEDMFIALNQVLTKDGLAHISHCCGVQFVREEIHFIMEINCSFTDIKDAVVEVDETFGGF